MNVTVTGFTTVPNWTANLHKRTITEMTQGLMPQLWFFASQKLRHAGAK